MAVVLGLLKTVLTIVKNDLTYKITEENPNDDSHGMTWQLMTKKKFVYDFRYRTIIAKYLSVHSKV